jgi:hypothetical protein
MELITLVVHPVPLVALSRRIYGPTVPVTLVVEPMSLVQRAILVDEHPVAVTLPQSPASTVYAPVVQLVGVIVVGLLTVRLVVLPIRTQSLADSLT